jgi:CubicO group peptidase (beta-lactamase class C family)
VTDIRGVCPARFAAVRQAFEANFAEDRELGARFALAVDGEVVVDLMGGFADRAETRPFDEDTLTPVFSTTKALAALMVARAAGQGLIDYEQRVADLWPEFAGMGKGAITVGQALSHQGGLCGFLEPMEATLWFDWAAIRARLEAMSPLWPPGTASGYHPVTFGYIAGELFRRADGRELGAALHEDIALPFGLDLWIGLPDSEHGRCADLRRPPKLPDLGPMTEPKRAAFGAPWSSPSPLDLARWRRAAIPSVTGHATAPALARLMAILACGGRLDGVQTLSPEALEAATRERVRGADLVLPYAISWGAGFMRNAGLQVFGPGERTVGHYGWGGSCAFADPETQLSGAYVMNRQSDVLVGDARARRLIDAAYAGLRG